MENKRIDEQINIVVNKIEKSAKYSEYSKEVKKIMLKNLFIKSQELGIIERNEIVLKVIDTFETWCLIGGIWFVEVGKNLGSDNKGGLEYRLGQNIENYRLVLCLGLFIITELEKNGVKHNGSFTIEKSLIVFTVTNQEACRFIYKKMLGENKPWFGLECRVQEIKTYIYEKELGRDVVLLKRDIEDFTTNLELKEKYNYTKKLILKYLFIYTIVGMFIGNGSCEQYELKNGLVKKICLSIARTKGGELCLDYIKTKIGMSDFGYIREKINKKKDNKDSYITSYELRISGLEEVLKLIECLSSKIIGRQYERINKLKEVIECSEKPGRVGLKEAIREFRLLSTRGRQTEGWSQDQINNKVKEDLVRCVTDPIYVKYGRYSILRIKEILIEYNRKN